MNRFYFVKSARLLFLGILIVLLMISMLPIPTAQAQEAITSDLAVSLVSIPKHAKACQTFEAVYTVTNLGPNPASHLYLGVSIPDAYDVVEIAGMPESLAVGGTATVMVSIKVTAFVPGEIREAWVGVNLISDLFPDSSIDLNPDNNIINSQMKIVGKHVDVCS